MKQAVCNHGLINTSHSYAVLKLPFLVVMRIHTNKYASHGYAIIKLPPLVSFIKVCFTPTEANLLSRTGAVAMDYFYLMELPTDFSSEKLSEISSDLEFRWVLCQTHSFSLQCLVLLV